MNYCSEELAYEVSRDKTKPIDEQRDKEVLLEYSLLVLLPKKFANRYVKVYFEVSYYV